jgi:hypothetical protein
MPATVPPSFTLIGHLRSIWKWATGYANLRIIKRML